MHLLLIIHSLGGGGAERVTSQMAEYWCGKGYRVTVVTFASAENNRYELPGEVEYRALGIAKSSEGFLSGMVNIFSRVGIVRRVVKETRPDVAIAMMTGLTIQTGLACIGLPTKCIGSERIYPDNARIGRAWSLLRKYTYRFVDTIIVQSEKTEKWLYENTNAKRIAVIANSLHMPLRRLEPIRLPEKNAGEKWILGVGRLTPQKQFDHLIRCFSALTDHFPEWNLVIVGEGSDRSVLEDLAVKCQKEKRIKFVGRVGNISDWYEAADVFALTSRIEGFPNALIEAMAHGVACVSYDCLTGPGDIIDSGVNGLLVNANDEGAYLDALRQLFSSDQLRKQFSERSVGIADDLRPDLIMSQWELEIRRLLNG